MKRGSAFYRTLDRAIGIPILRATGLFALHRRLPENPRRIGIMTSPTLGDTLLISSCVLDIRKALPRARLILFSFPSNKPAARLLPCLDEIADIRIAKPALSIAALRRAGLDVLFDFTQWQRITALYSALSGAKCRVGFRSRGQARHYHYDITAEHSPEVHETENFRELLRSAGIPAKSQPALAISEQASSPGRRIVFHPWASGSVAGLRQWPSSHWADLAVQLNSRGTNFVITGSPADRARSEQLRLSLARRRVEAAVYESGADLSPLGAMLRSSDLVVSVNTGILHLAAIAGAPTIALNGPTATRRWGPVGPRATSVEPADGSGGFLHFGFEFDGNPRDTMSRIQVDDVVAAALSLMKTPLRAAQKAG